MTRCAARSFNRLICALIVALGLFQVGEIRTAAWGFDVHRFVVEQAIGHLPPAMRSFYEQRRVFLMEHSVDPDLWRSAGFEDEPPRHFLDLDAYGAYPFEALPRDYRAALRKFGAETVVRNGLLPWRAAEIYDRLVKALERTKQGNVHALDDVTFLSAVLSHYVADGFMPFHAVLNYDGQATGQLGIHARFETDLFRRYRSRLSVKVGEVRPVTEPRDFVFDALAQGTRLVPRLLDADSQALGSGVEYDDRYFDAFFAGAQPVLERRLSEAITGVASVWVGAWEAAGRPALPLEVRFPVRKVRPGEQR